MTNAEKIRNMTNDELAEFLDRIKDCCGDKTGRYCEECPMCVGDGYCFTASHWLTLNTLNAVE